MDEPDRLKTGPAGSERAGHGPLLEGLQSLPFRMLRESHMLVPKGQQDRHLRSERIETSPSRD
jgi:hypothetical protein